MASAIQPGRLRLLYVQEAPMGGIAICLTLGRCSVQRTFRRIA